MMTMKLLVKSQASIIFNHIEPRKLRYFGGGVGQIESDDGFPNFSCLLADNFFLICMNYIDKLLGCYRVQMSDVFVSLGCLQ